MVKTETGMKAGLVLVITVMALFPGGSLLAEASASQKDLLAEAWTVLEEAARPPDSERQLRARGEPRANPLVAVYAVEALRRLPGERSRTLLRSILAADTVFEPARVDALKALQEFEGGLDYDLLKRAFHSAPLRTPRGGQAPPLLRTFILQALPPLRSREGGELVQEYIGLSSSEHVLSIGVHVLLEIGAVLPLVELAHNEEPQVRLFAVSALGRIQTFADTNLLMKLLAGEDDAEVRKACWIALARKGDEAALLELQDQIRKTTDWKLKLEYANLLVELGRSEFYQVFGELLQANDPAARWSAISRLKRLEGPIAGPYLLRAVQDADPRVRRSARFALAGILNDPPPELLREGLESDDPMLAAAWIEAVGRLNLQIDVSQPLRRALTSGNPLAEEKSFDYIEVHDRREFRPLLVEMLRTSIEQKQDRNAVSRILRILGRWDDRECLELVKEAYLKDVFGLGSSAACADFIVRVSEPDEAITFFRDVLRREYDLYLGGLDRKQILAAAMLVRLLDGPPRGPESLPE